MALPFTHHEKYRSEHSMNLAAVCNIDRSFITVLFYDLSLERSVARSVLLNAEIDTENACTELSRLIFLSSREHNIPASAVRQIGCAAPMDISGALEESLDPADMFLPPDIEIIVLPFVSMFADGRFAAALAAASREEGVFAAHFGKTLNMAYFGGGELKLASVPLSGAFDGSALESGIPCEYGAIDEVHRETDGTLCYSVVGDADSAGISAAAALDAVSVMLAEGIIDPDGIMTDRDLFYIGEDLYISQSDVRAVQSDKARAGAAVECFLKAVGQPSAVYFTGELFGGRGMERLAELGVISEGMSRSAGFCRSTVEQGIIALLTGETEQERLNDLILSAEDITDLFSSELDELYIRNLSF